MKRQWKRIKTFYLDADDFADLADWYGTRRRFDKAIEIAEYGLRLHPSNTELMIEYAYLLIDSGQMEKAREVARNFPESYLPEAKVLRAALLLSEGKLNDAEELLDTIEDKDDIANVIDVAYTFLEMGYPDKAKSGSTVRRMSITTMQPTLPLWQTTIAPKT